MNKSGGVTGVLLLGMSCIANADDGVNLGTTRVIYPSDSKGVNLTVNNNADYPFLIKTVVLDESTRQVAPFVVIPPLFRLDGGQHNTVTIMRTGGNYPSDRETIGWVCVRSIPPEPGDIWGEGKNGEPGTKPSMKVQLTINNCIKLFVRPDSVKGNSVDVADKVSWAITGKNITASNPTPFYINVSSVYVNGRRIDVRRGYIPPFSDEKYSLPEGITAKARIQWTVVGDYGEKKEKTVTLK